MPFTFTPGTNCWRIERCETAAVVVDAERYFRAVIDAMEASRARILIIGWDFDARVDLNPDEHGRYSLGRFFLSLAKRRPERAIDILKWSFGAKKQFLNPKATWYLWRWARTKAIDFKFDSHHPIGCSHHQKILVIDDCLSACGGIDMALARWDTPDHVDNDKRRQLPNGKLYGPWHDISLFMTGPVSGALSELGEIRWQRATGASLATLAPCDALDLPECLPPQFRDIDIAISRTVAPYQDVEEVREIEQLYLDMIAAAKRFIYLENQYFSSARIAKAIAERMKEADPPEIVLVMPRNADGWIEQKAMDSARYHLVKAVGDVDPNNRFRIYVPVTRNGVDIYVHAKLAIVDDEVMTIGSANLNNRSMGLDSECNVSLAVEPGSEGSAMIATIRTQLLAEHLDVETDAFNQAFTGHGSLIKAIDTLRGNGKTLELLDLEDPGLAGTFIAENELLDPDRPDEFMEPITERSLWRRWVARRKKRR